MCARVHACACVCEHHFPFELIREDTHPLTEYLCVGVSVGLRLFNPDTLQHLFFSTSQIRTKALIDTLQEKTFQEQKSKQGRNISKQEVASELPYSQQKGLTYNTHILSENEEHTLCVQ